MITREHVEQIVARAGLPEPDRQRILALDFPVDLAVVMRQFESVGVTRDWLVSRVGGSP